MSNSNPYCPDCDVEMDEETLTQDFNDPSDYHGHGQISSDVYICPNCKEQYDKAMFNDDEDYEVE